MAPASNLRVGHQHHVAYEDAEAYAAWAGKSLPTEACVPQNPQGGSEADSLDAAQPNFRVPRKVIKGGSFLCAGSYCMRYRPAARRPQMIDTGMTQIGFRCVVRSAAAG